MSQKLVHKSSIRFIIIKLLNWFGLIGDISVVKMKDVGVIAAQAILFHTEFIVENQPKPVEYFYDDEADAAFMRQFLTYSILSSSNFDGSNGSTASGSM